MILYIGDKEQYDYFSQFSGQITAECELGEAEKIILTEDSLRAASAVEYAAASGIPLLGVLEGFEAVIKTLDGTCVPLENCSEGKQELAVVDPEVPIYRNLEHVITICRGIPVGIDETTMPGFLRCISRSEAGDIIAIEFLREDGMPSDLYALNVYLNSSLTRMGDQVVKNFLNL